MPRFGILRRFVFVGLVNTIITLLIIFIAKALLGMEDGPANGLGYSVGLLFSFELNRSWTFRHTGSVARALPAFLFVQAVAYVANLLCVLILIEYGVNSYWAQVLGVPPYAVISFLGSRYFAFRVAAFNKLF